MIIKYLTLFKKIFFKHDLAFDYDYVTNKVSKGGKDKTYFEYADYKLKWSQFSITQKKNK